MDQRHSERKFSPRLVALVIVAFTMAAYWNSFPRAVYLRRQAGYPWKPLYSAPVAPLGAVVSTF